MITPQNITAFKDLVNILAIFLAGIWSYYLFIKGRTVADSVTLDARQINVGSKTEDAIVRLTVTNVGKTKLSNLKGEASFHYCFYVNGKYYYLPYLVIPDILAIFQSSNVELEPGMNMKIDVPLRVEGDKSKLLLMRSTIIANKSKNYSENILLHINEGGKS